MKEFIRQIFAVTEKELRLQLRYGKDFLLRIIVTPLFIIIPYFILYQGIFNLGTGGIGDLTPENYPVWLFLGAIYLTFLNSGFGSFEGRFLTEKYWITIQTLFLAPINKNAYLIGVMIQSLLINLIPLIVFLTLSFIVLPITLVNVTIVLLLFIMVLGASAGIGIVRGGIALVNENYKSIIGYFIFFILFFSCYSLPLSILPDYLHFFANLNPFYHGLVLIRSIWFNTLDITFLYSFFYLIIFTTVCLIIGVWIFNKLIKKYGIHGY